LGLGTIYQQCGISLFLVYLTKNKEIPHCWYIVPNPNRNKLKTKKYHTVGLVPNPNRNKLKTKKYNTVGLVPNTNRNKIKTKKYNTVFLCFYFISFGMRN
jgi:hypothetical protein